MTTLYKCPNIGNCSKAELGEIISIVTAAPTDCPECGAKLILAKATNSKSNVAMYCGIVLILLLSTALGAWYFFKQKTSAPDPAPIAAIIIPAEVAPSPPPPMPKAAQTLLRFHGSNTIGGKLLPALAIAFLKQQGYSNVHKEDGAKEEESFIIGEKNGHSEQLEIQSHGSSTAFKDLKDGICDIGMSSRKIKPQEQQSLAPTHGDLSSNASEHVLALDGIAVIVNSSNPIKTLSLAQVADIYSGTLTDWSKLGGPAGTIAIYARDDKSGTYDFFKEAVLHARGKSLSATAQRFEDSEKLSAAVAANPTGIGFIGLNYIGTNKTLAISDTNVDARKPNLMTIKTEDYLLSRRLYLYTSTKSTNPDIAQFIDFALSSAAAQVVASAGLVNLDVTPLIADTNDVRNQSPQWQNLTKNAIEIATRFRFRSGGNELDSRANRDIGRIVGVLSQPQYQNKKVLLIGFADSRGTHEVNCKLSQNRADIVKKELGMEGLIFDQVVGLCDAAPIAPNDTDENREKNRRVEVWVK